LGIAGDYLDERGFARAVIAHEADHFACLHGKRNVVDSLSAKMLEMWVSREPPLASRPSTAVARRPRHNATLP
jgi:hypothetical protein